VSSTTTGSNNRKIQVHHTNRHPWKKEIAVAPQNTLFSRRREYSSSRSKSEDLILLDSDNEDDEEINSKGEDFVEEKVSIH